MTNPTPVEAGTELNPPIPPIATPADRRAGGLREVARLAYPVVLQNVSVTTLHMVDTAFLGRLGLLQAVSRQSQLA